LAPVATAPTTAAPTTTTVDPTKAAILAAYRAHWDDVIGVAETVPIKPLDPRLAEHTTGKQLLSEQQALTRLSVLGHYNQGSTDLSPTVTAVSGDSATVTDCIFDHSIEMDFRTKTAVEAPDIGHTLDVFVLTRVNGSWFVSDSTVMKSGKTGDECTPPTG
jgi:hypothetical protein